MASLFLLFLLFLPTEIPEIISKINPLPAVPAVPTGHERVRMKKTSLTSLATRWSAPDWQSSSDYGGADDTSPDPIEVEERLAIQAEARGDYGHPVPEREHRRQVENLLAVAALTLIRTVSAPPPGSRQHTRQENSR